MPKKEVGNGIEITHLLRWVSFPLLSAGLALIVSLAGADFVLTSGSWKEGLIWGFFSFLAWSFLLFLSPLRSPHRALLCCFLFFLVTTVSSQYFFYETARSRLWSRVQRDDKNQYPESWKGLDSESLYRSYLQGELGEENAGGWWDHLRAQAHAGISHTERRGPRKVGGKPQVIFRQGFWVWWGWSISYLSLALGSLFGISGVAIREIRRSETEDKNFIHTFTGNVTNILRNKGLSENEIQKILRHRPRPEITEAKICELLSLETGEHSRLIYEDLQLAFLLLKQVIPEENFVDKTEFGESFAKKLIAENFPSRSEEWLKEIRDTRTRHYGLQALNDPIPRSSHLLLLAGTRYQFASPHLSLYRALEAVYDVTRYCQLGLTLLPFPRLDLSQIPFTPLFGDEQFSRLVGFGPQFYRDQSSWSLLEDFAPDEIPEGAYQAVLYQYLHTPDPRAHEMWFGRVPFVYIQALGDKLFHALLTYLEHWEKLPLNEPPRSVPKLTNIVVSWPEEKAEPILRACIEAGWRGSLPGLPDTPRWRDLLLCYEPTPFGDLAGYVPWFEKLKRAGKARPRGSVE